MEEPNALLSYSIGNIIAFIIVIAVNTMANTIPLGGFTTGELSDMYPNLFVPAGITFSIWGLIYLLLTAFIFYSFFSISRTAADSSFILAAGPWFIVSSAANAGWIFAWHYRRPLLSLVCMLLILFSLIMVYLRMGSFKPPNFGTALVTKIPFSIYLGWITVATAANVTAVLVHYGWNGFGLAGNIWTIILIGAVLIITAVMIISRNDPAYTAVILWALAGIIIKQGAAGGQPSVTAAAASALGILAAVQIIRLIIRG